MNIDAAVGTLVAALGKHQRKLEHIAAAGGAPIDVAGELIGTLFEKMPLGQAELVALIAAADNIIDELLLPVGFEPISQDEGTIHPLPHSWRKKVYVQLAEYTLFEAIDRGDPVVMVSAYEAKRFAKQIVQRYGTAGEGRPFFIWRGSTLYSSGPVRIRPPECLTRLEGLAGAVALAYCEPSTSTRRRRVHSHSQVPI